MLTTVPKPVFRSASFVDATCYEARANQRYRVIFRQDGNALIFVDIVVHDDITNALQLYAALPAQSRAATLEALRSPDPAAHTALVR